MSDANASGDKAAADQARAAELEESKDPTQREEIRFRRRGGVGEVALRRPKALNSLTLSMIREFDPYLRNWAANPGVRAVVAYGEGDKAFCAGGDVRAVWEAARTRGDGSDGEDLTRTFFHEEYNLNRRIRALPKPYVALIDGITMGGGVGISVHGSHRLAGDRTMVAMPETGIGFFPDVGTTYVLSRMPGHLGLYLGLTGYRLNAADAVHAGFATHYVPSEQVLPVVDALVGLDWSDDANADVDRVLADVAEDPGPAQLADLAPLIDRCFAGDSLESVLRALENEGGDWAKSTLETLHKLSPTSLKLTFAAIRRAAELDFDDCLRMEYRLSQGCMAGHDFHEGIRALLVDKDKSPAWRPADVAQVDDAEIARYFESLGERELVLSD